MTDKIITARSKNRRISAVYRQGLDGFDVYIKSVVADRGGNLSVPCATFERGKYFAMGFGISKEAAKELVDVLTAAIDYSEGKQDNTR